MTTTWSGIPTSETTWSGVPMSETSWSDNILLEPIFGVPSCEILPEDGPFITMCETISGTAPSEGGVPMCEMGENATFWERIPTSTTDYTTVTGVLTTWTDIVLT